MPVPEVPDLLLRSAPYPPSRPKPGASGMMLDPLESPGLLPLRAGILRPEPVPPAAAWPDEQPASRGSWLAFLLAGLVLLVHGWLLPLLGSAFLALPIIGLALTRLGGWRQRHSASSPD